MSLEVVWATKQCPNQVFAFLLAITEVNCFLAESYFTSRKTDTPSMLNFWKSLASQLIENTYLEQEEIQHHCRSTGIQEGVGHGLVLLQHSENSWTDVWLSQCPNIPPKNALDTTAKYKPIAGALLVSTCAVIALWNTLMI